MKIKKHSLVRATVITCLLLLSTACVSTKNVSVNNESVSGFYNKKVSQTKRTVPAFAAITAGKATFGAIGGAAMISAGNEIIRDNDVKDPANYIANTLINDLSREYNMEAIESAGTLASEKPSAIAQLYSNANYVLDIRTINWSFGYFPTDWNNYRVIYSAKLRLFDTKKQSVIAEGFCSRVPDKTPDSPSKKELLADQAYILKAELRLGANKCIEEFRQNVLNLPSVALAELEAPMRKVAIASPNDNATEGEVSSDPVESNKQTAYPDLLAGVTSSSSAEMRRSAIEIGQQKIYNDEGIFLASINVLQQANQRTITKKEKILIDGLSWIALNLGHSKDERARSILLSVGNNEVLPRKFRNHAIHAAKIMDGLIDK